MRRILILFLAILLVRTYSFSQTISTGTEQDSIVSVTPEQIKYANLIFVEHEKLLIENSLLNREVQTLNLINSDLEQVDSLRVQQLSEYETLRQSQALQIEGLTKDLKKSRTANTCWKVGCFTVSVGLILFLLLK